LTIGLFAALLGVFTVVANPLPPCNLLATQFRCVTAWVHARHVHALCRSSGEKEYNADIIAWWTIEAQGKSVTVLRNYYRQLRCESVRRSPGASGVVVPTFSPSMVLASDPGHVMHANDGMVENYSAREANCLCSVE
jgi:hypothetical protein